MDQMEGTWEALGDDLGNLYMSTSSPSPGAVRSFGSAKARYDFCARDRTELTLREGDIIRVLSKKGHPGWWKGEIYGRVWHLPHPKVPPPAPSSSHLFPMCPLSSRLDGSPQTTWKKITRSIADHGPPPHPIHHLVSHHLCPPTPEATTSLSTLPSPH